jgi:hypothetical protein
MWWSTSTSPAWKAAPGGSVTPTPPAPSPPTAARRLACDAAITRVITGPDSEILDIGRKTRVIPAGLRRAVMIRDRHCTHPGCDVPAIWCEIHHIIHWADGGPTTLTNLTLRCPRHHHHTHQQRE